MTGSERYLNDRACGVLLVCVVGSGYLPKMVQGRTTSEQRLTDVPVCKIVLSGLISQKRKVLGNQLTTSALADPWPPPESAYNKQVSIGTGPQNPVWLITFNYTSGGRPDACVSLHGEEMVPGFTMGRRQANNGRVMLLGNILRGKLGPCYFGMYRR